MMWPYYCCMVRPISDGERPWLLSMSGNSLQFTIAGHVLPSVDMANNCSLCFWLILLFYYIVLLLSVQSMHNSSSTQVSFSLWMSLPSHIWFNFHRIFSSSSFSSLSKALTSYFPSCWATIHQFPFTADPWFAIVHADGLLPTTSLHWSYKFCKSVACSRYLSQACHFLLSGWKGRNIHSTPKK